MDCGGNNGWKIWHRLSVWPHFPLYSRAVPNHDKVRVTIFPQLSYTSVSFHYIWPLIINDLFSWKLLEFEDVGKLHDDGNSESETLSIPH